jgi:hypothetical protein
MKLLSVLLLALVIAAGAALDLASRPLPDNGRQAAEFHRLVGGLGFGPALDLERCEGSFDPRLCPACSNDGGPIPAGMVFCPHHACSVFDWSPPQPHGDAQVP